MHKLYRNYGKRLFDIFLSIGALLFLWPIMVIVALLVRIKLGSPVLFKQERPGKNEKIFTLYKFRTMTNRKDSNGNLLSDAERLTKFGKFLRSTSLDELPEIWNVIKGDMSWVGPRPLLIKDVIFMDSFQRLRHLARPGITGLAQVNGRNMIDWTMKLSLDTKYAVSISFIGDLLIMIKTIFVVFSRRGINSYGNRTDLDYGVYLLEQNLICEQQYEDTLRTVGTLNK